MSLVDSCVPPIDYNAQRQNILQVLLQWLLAGGKQRHLKVQIKTLITVEA
jgi:hypothetical protein